MASFSFLNFFFGISFIVLMKSVDVFGQNRFCRSINRMDCSKGFSPQVICANDGKNYQNDCAFSKALCKNPKLKEEHKGPCIVSTKALPTTTTTKEPSTKLGTDLTSQNLVSQTEGPTPFLTTIIPTVKTTTEEKLIQQSTTEKSLQTPKSENSTKFNTDGPSTQQPAIEISTQNLNIANSTEHNIGDFSTQRPSTDELEEIIINTEINVSGTFVIVNKDDDPTTTEETMTTENSLDVSTTTSAPDRMTPENVTPKEKEITTLPFGPIVKSFFCTWNSNKDVYCDPSHKDYACASDHKTYRTRCDLLKARCDFPGIYMVQEGICPGHKLAIEYTDHEFILHIIGEDK